MDGVGLLRGLEVQLTVKLIAIELLPDACLGLILCSLGKRNLVLALKNRTPLIVDLYFKSIKGSE